LIFATADRADRPVPGEYVYFEIPEGVEKIKDLDTEVHLFLFDKLPPNPHAALRQIDDAWAKYTCITPGADNKSGYVALEAQWHIEAMPTPRLKRDPSGIHRPTRSAGLQQVRAEVISPDVPAFEYLFEREQTGWIPEFDDTPAMGVAEPPAPWPGRLAWDEAMGPRGDGWQLVRNLVPRVGIAREKDQAVLEQLKPESGSFLLVSLRRRRI
jgi:hypothetical protein